MEVVMSRNDVRVYFFQPNAQDCIRCLLFTGLRDSDYTRMTTPGVRMYFDCLEGKTFEMQADAQEKPDATYISAVMVEE